MDDDALRGRDDLEGDRLPASAERKQKCFRSFAIHTRAFFQGQRELDDLLTALVPFGLRLGFFGKFFLRRRGRKSDRPGELYAEPAEESVLPAVVLDHRSRGDE